MANLHCACSKPRRSRRIFTWRSRPRAGSKSKLSIARLWRWVARTMVRPVCARTTTRTTMQLSSLVRTGTTSKWFATNPRPDPSIKGTSTSGYPLFPDSGVHALAAGGRQPGIEGRHCVDLLVAEALRHRVHDVCKGRAAALARLQQAQLQPQIPRLLAGEARVVRKARSLLQAVAGRAGRHPAGRSEEHTSELQSLMRISYAVFCL